MDEEVERALAENAKYYEDKYEPVIENLLDEKRRLQGKYNRLKNKHDALKKAMKKYKSKDKQHYKNGFRGSQNARK